MSDARHEPSPAGAAKGGEHVCPSDAQHDRETPEADLFRPLRLRGVTVRNRVVMSPMCHELGVEPTWPTQYGYAVKRRPR